MRRVVLQIGHKTSFYASKRISLVWHRGQARQMLIRHQRYRNAALTLENSKLPQSLSQRSSHSPLSLTKRVPDLASLGLLLSVGESSFLSFLFSVRT